jgi:hypothetical protein
MTLRKVTAGLGARFGIMGGQEVRVGVVRRGMDAEVLGSPLSIVGIALSMVVLALISTGRLNGFLMHGPPELRRGSDPGESAPRSRHELGPAQEQCDYSGLLHVS